MPKDNGFQLVESGPVEGFKVETIAASLDVHPKTLYRAIERGELGCLRIGRAIRVTRDQLDRYLRRATANA